MEAFFLKLVNMSITASWLVLAVMAVRLIFRQTPKWILCLLWGLVAVRLIFPFAIESSLSLIPDTEPLSQPVVYSAEPLTQARGEILDSEENLIAEQHPPAAGGEILDSEGNVVMETKEGAVSYPEIAQSKSWTYYLSRIWMIGILGMLIYTVVSYHLLKRKVATAIPVRRGIKQSEFIDSPFVLGLIRPVIYLPYDMAEADMSYVIAHEKAHIRRRDHWWKPLGFLLLSIYWFNPVMWAAYILLCRDIEAACDEKVIRDMDKDDRRAYSTALLNCSIHRRRIAACPLAFGEVGVKARVKGVMNYKKPAFWFIVICLLPVAIVSVCFLTNPDAATPITMSMDYVNRTRADLKFHYDEGFPEGEYQISPAYSLESRVNGKWQELTRLKEGETSEQVHKVTSDDPDFDAWSLLNWEDSYGRLPDGTYRIKKDIIKNNTLGNPETRSLYAEFTIGGAADDYITYTLEEITPAGAKLYEQETVDDTTQLIYDGNEGIWLEAWQDGQWKYAEPTQFIEPAFREEKLYIHQLVFSSTYTKLDWSSLYGSLPGGNYRICRGITVVSDSELRHCTAYASFSIDTVYTWFDRNSIEPDAFQSYSDHIVLTGTDGVMLQVGRNDNIELSENRADRYETVIESGQLTHNVFLTDLTGDGISEICATTSGGAGVQVRVYDYASDTLHTLQDEKLQFMLTKAADRLVVLQQENGFTTDIKQLGLRSGKLELCDLDQELIPLTKTVSCVDIWTRKYACLSSPQQMQEVLTLLRNMEKKIQPVSGDVLAAAQEDMFDVSYITVNYELGEKSIHFSKDFDIIWEYGATEGYRLTEPGPIRKFVESVTNGVRDNQTSGKPFAAMDAPWDWCAEIDQSAVESARLHVCLRTYSSGDISGSTSTSGFLSYETLQKLTDILNRVPKTAFTPGKLLSKESYSGFFIDQSAQNTAISIVDGVNNLGMILSCRNGKMTMLLTNEMEKVRNTDESYLKDTQLWTVEDDALLAYMQFLSENHPVISYSVGAEYEWQKPMEFTAGSFTMGLRLIENWESEYVANPDNSGIRCRPEGITDGWIYFSYWPEGYHPKEENRYYGEGSSWGHSTITSYPSSVKSRLGVDVRHAIWSFMKIDLDQGDYVIINDGADRWFLEYEDQIEDIITLCGYSEE